MKYSIPFFILLVIVVSCKDSTNAKDDKVVIEEVNESVFSILNEADYDINKLDYEGEVVNKRFWQDANGENIVVFTKSKSEIYVYHYLIAPEGPKLLRKVYDLVIDCEWDTILEFVENSISVTDLDENKTGEITFAYKISCISDVSPVGLKLLLLENGDKYVIRGETIINMGGQEIGGDKNVDASFKNAPKEFILHADEVWSKAVKE